MGVEGLGVVAEPVPALGFPPGTRVQHDGGDVSVTTP